MPDNTEVQDQAFASAQEALLRGQDPQAAAFDWLRISGYPDTQHTHELAAELADEAHETAIK